MALYNILRKTDVVLNGRGQPVGGGEVFLYEPGGTTTQITAYKDSGLQTAHTQPIRLSGTGRANIWVTRDCDMYVYDRNGNLVAQELNANPATLGAEQSGGLINNGSFEVDDDGNDEPDFWDRSDEAGSSNNIDTTESTDGAQSFQFVSSGSGGGTLTTSDFFPVNDSDDLRVDFDLLASVATVRNIVRVQWFDVSQVSISNTDVYDSTSNPTSWTSFNRSATPPANARFAKLAIIGCESSGAAGSTNVDRVSVFYPALVSGTFDNVLIQNNEIITTNTNGSLAITPNGNGSVDIGNTNNPDLSDSGNSANIGSDDPDNEAHLALGPSLIQAKTDGTTAAALGIQTLGGNLTLGNSSANLTLQANPIVSGAAPALVLLETDASTDEGRWDYAGVSGQLRFRAINDANGGHVNWLTVDRSGTNIDAIRLNGDIVDLGATGVVQDYGGTDRRMGWVPVPITASSSRSFAAADLLNIVHATAAITLTVDTGLGSDGNLIQVVTDASPITIAEGSGATLTKKLGGSSSTGNATVAAHSVVFLERRSSGAWDITGSGLT